MGESCARTRTGRLLSSSGQAALALIEHSQPDLIFLDIYMSVMDGPQFAQAYRQMPGPHAPIVVITATEHAAAQAAQINADGYLGKPFGLSELRTIIDQYLTPRD